MRTYLGDGVYVVIEDDMVKLTTEDGIEITNTIYLDIHVLKSFLEWLQGNKL